MTPSLYIPKVYALQHEVPSTPTHTHAQLYAPLRDPAVMEKEKCAESDTGIEPRCRHLLAGWPWANDPLNFTSSSEKGGDFISLTGCGRDPGEGTYAEGQHPLSQVIVTVSFLSSSLQNVFSNYPKLLPPLTL